MTNYERLLQAAKALTNSKGSFWDRHPELLESSGDELLSDDVNNSLWDDLESAVNACEIEWDSHSIESKADIDETR